MNIRTVSLLRCLIVSVAALLLAVSPARAQFELDFVIGSGANPVDPNTTYITFINGVNGTANLMASGNLSASSSPIFVAGGALMSQSYSLSQLINGGNFSFTSSNQATNFFITYGNQSDSFSNITSRPSPTSTTSPRYSLIELAGGGGDITQIDQFGGAVRVDDYKYSVSSTTPVKSTYNNANTASVFANISKSIGANSSAIVTESNGSGGQQYVRIIGPSKTNDPTAYPTYNNYLSSLHTNSVTTNLANNFGNDGPIGMNYIGTVTSGNFTVTNQTWVAAYNFNATVDSGGNIVFNGSVTMQGAAGTGGGNATYNGLYIILPKGTNGTLQTESIYGMTVPSNAIFGSTNASITTNGNVSGNVGGSPSFSGNATWDGLDQFTTLPAGNTSNTTFATTNNLLGNNTVNLKVTGDFQEGMATGFVGSNISANLSGNMLIGNETSATTYGNLSSAQWWTLADKSYLNGAQPNGSTLFNQYGLSIFGDSNTTLFDGTNTTILSGGAVYASPYDDRFGSALLGADDKWVVTLLPDGNLTVGAVIPEPATEALLAAGAVLVVAIVRRRKLLRGASEQKQA